MDIEKNERINALFEFYQPLLTKKQNEYIQLYYADDYSLGEIAEGFEVSRQAVYADFEMRNRQADRIQRYVKEHYPDDAELNNLIANMENMEEE